MSGRPLDARVPPAGHSARPDPTATTISAHFRKFPTIFSTLSFRACAYFVLALVLYLSISLFSIGKPLTLDQAMPVAYNSAAIADYGFSALGSDERYYEVAHPTLHQHLVAVVYNVFGKSTASTRIVNLVCFGAVLLLIISLARQLFLYDRGVEIGGAAALLYAVNPFVIQYSLVVDQDTTVHPITVLLFFLVLFRQNLTFSGLATVKLGGLLALCMWAKEFSLFFILSALFLFLLCQRGLLDALQVTAQIGAIGVAVFAATWTVYCLATGVPILSFVEFSILNKAFSANYHQGRSVMGGLRTLLTGVGLWVTPAFLGLLALAAGHRLLQLVRDRFEVRLGDLLWIYVAVFWVITNFYMYSNARWQFPLYSVAVILIAEYVWTVVKDPGKEKIIGSMLIGLIVAAPLAWLLSDPLLLSAADSLPAAAAWYLAFWFVAPLAVCFLLLAVYRLPILSRARAALAILSLLIATSIALNVKQADSYTTSSSWGSDYGERGFYETVAYLKGELGTTVPIIRKDLAYYLMLEKYGWQYNWVSTHIFRGDLDVPAKAVEIRETTLRDDVEYVVIDRNTNRKEAVDVITPYFDLVQTFGDFQVFRKNAEGFRPG